jgi:hypothetical protein
MWKPPLNEASILFLQQTFMRMNAAYIVSDEPTRERDSAFQIHYYLNVTKEAEALARECALNGDVFKALDDGDTYYEDALDFFSDILPLGLVNSGQLFIYDYMDGIGYVVLAPLEALLEHGVPLSDIELAPWDAARITPVSANPSPSIA